MTIEISAFGMLVLVVFLIAPELFYVPWAIAGWVIDGVLNLFLGPKNKGEPPS